MRRQARLDSRTRAADSLAAPCASSRAHQHGGHASPPHAFLHRDQKCTREFAFLDPLAHCSQASSSGFLSCKHHEQHCLCFCWWSVGHTGFSGAVHMGLADLPWPLQLSQQVQYHSTCSRSLTQRRLQPDIPLSSPEAVHVQQVSIMAMPLSTT